MTEPRRLIAERVQVVSHTHLPVVGAFCSAAGRDANLGDSGCRSNVLQNSQQTAQQRTLVWPPTVFLPPAISALPGAPSQCRLSDPTLVAQWLKNLPTVQETWVWSMGWEDPLEAGMATHSSILAWEVPWTEEPGKLQSMELQRVRLDWVTKHTLQVTCIHITLREAIATVFCWTESEMKARRPWWLSGKESACQSGRHGLDPWSGKISHATEQLSSCTAATQPVF